MQNKFCGWYFKCQSDTQTLAVIPASHGGTHSIQLITDDGAWSFPYDAANNRFAREGLRLDLRSEEASAVGAVRFGAFTPLRYDIMGPFRFVPFLQCRHSVVSMIHRVDGAVTVNGKRYVFHNGRGYIEGDRGRSFPREYAWTQSFFDRGSLMLSVADIPLAGLRFTGVIGVVRMDGREIRLATYLGAKALQTAQNTLVIRQGDTTFTARLLEKRRCRSGRPWAETWCVRSTKARRAAPPTVWKWTGRCCWSWRRTGHRLNLNTEGNHESTGTGEIPLSSPARRKPGGLVSVGGGSV